jgi:hypothetical protein
VVRPLVEEIVRMPQEIMQILKKGERNRKTAGTDWVSLWRTYATQQRESLTRNNGIVEREEFPLACGVHDCKSNGKLHLLEALRFNVVTTDD